MCAGGDDTSLGLGFEAKREDGKKCDPPDDEENGECGDGVHGCESFERGLAQRGEQGNAADWLGGYGLRAFLCA